MKSNKLWVMPTTAETLEIVSERPHSYGNADHCLFIGPEELREYLTEADWRWIYSESDKIRAEQEAVYRKRAEEAREAFLKRFDAELEKEMAGDLKHEPEENSAGSAESK